MGGQADDDLRSQLRSAIQHHQAGRLQEAESGYRTILQRRPDHPEALHLLGAIAHQVGRLDVALDLIGRSLALDARPAHFHLNLGNLLRDLGRPDEAIDSYRQALARQPDYVEAHNNLGNALTDLGRLEEAVACYERALALRPAYAGGHNNLGLALKKQGRVEEAITSYERALARRPAFAEAHGNLAGALVELGALDEAVGAYRRALALQPDYAKAHAGLALALLLRGELAEGWAEYEWRWRCRDFPTRRRDLAQPAWDGRPLTGRTILLHAEQGLGDTLQFVRYVPLVAARGGRVVLECQPELRPLLDGFPGADQVVARGEALPPFDVQAPLLSLPHLLGTTPETIPTNVPYLRADPARAAAWAARLAGLEGLKVGLAWAGSPGHQNDRQRSLALAALAPLAAVPGVRWVSLQKGPAAAQASSPPPGLDLTDMSAELADFGATAALVDRLDLVITVDTAVAHLAGGLGKPVWVLLAAVPDWRWRLTGESSAWYPTARLFRQPRRGDWPAVIARVAEALRAISHQPSAVSFAR